MLSRRRLRQRHFSDAHAPQIGTLLKVVPTELPALHEIELVLQRERVMIVDQLHRAGRAGLRIRRGLGTTDKEKAEKIYVKGLGYHSIAKEMTAATILCG